MIFLELKNFELKLDRILCIFIEMFMYLVSGAQRAPTSGYITSCDERDNFFFFDFSEQNMCRRMGLGCMSSHDIMFKKAPVAKCSPIGNLK